MWKQRKDESPERPVTKPALGVVLCRRSRERQQRVVLHARWTCRHTRHAPETGVDVLNEARGVCFTAITPHFHQVDTASGRVVLVAPEDIRGARRQAKAAMDAVVEQIPSVR